MPSSPQLTASELTRTPSPRRSAALDGLRGYAAVTVVIYHAILGPNNDLIETLLYRSVLDQTEPGRILLKVALSVFNGEAAVAIFFVISGIVLLRSVRAMLARSEDRAWVTWAFLLRRVVRLWPLLAIVLCVHVGAFAIIERFWPGHVSPFSLDDLLRNVTFQSYPVNGASWTLRWELTGAPLILLWLFGGHRFGIRAVPPALIAIGVLAWFMPSLRHDPALVTTLPFLAAGMAIESGGLALIARLLRPGAALVAALAIIATELFLPVNGGHAWRHLSALLLSVSVFVAIVEAERPAPLTSLLRASLSQYLGRLSFSLYLWNVPIFELLFALLFAAVGPEVAHRHPIETGFVIGVTAVLLALPVADASERWLEQTSIRLGRALTRPPLRGASRSTSMARAPAE